MPKFYCCNPHKKRGHNRVTKNVRKVPGQLRALCEDINLVLGEYICSSCRLNLCRLKNIATTGERELENVDVSTSRGSEIDIPGSSSSSSNENKGSSTSTTSAVFVDQETERQTIITAVNKVLPIIKESPIKEDFSRDPNKRQKIDKIQKALKRKLFEDSSDSSEEEETVGGTIIKDLKEKFVSVADSSEKVRILTVLPESWSIRKIIKEFGTTFYMARKAKNLRKVKGLLSSPNLKPGQTLSAATATRVVDFYKDDSISRMMPGAKDFVSVKQENRRIHVQKRLVLCNLKETYEAFKEKYPLEKVGFSKFASLRPKECVLAGSSGTHSVCVCVIHQNPKLMLMAAKLGELETDTVAFPTTYKGILAMVMCQPPSTSCHLQNCSLCPGFEDIQLRMEKLFDEHFITQIEYKEWTQTDRCTLRTSICTPDEYVDRLLQQLRQLQTHDFIARTQSDFLKERKENLGIDELVVIADFSENYSFVIQDEVQSYHWTNTQATIHPFTIYHRSNNDTKSENFVIISDCLTHDTSAVHLFQCRLTSFVKTKFENRIEKMFYFSDGAASQYKNKYNFANLVYHQRDFGIQGEWHFFATSHGKGPCDGLGGTIKRLAKHASLQRPHTDQITDPLQLFQWANENIKNLNIEYCTKEEHANHTVELANRFQLAVPVKGTRKFHGFLPQSQTELIAKTFSSSEESSVVQVIRAIL